MDKELTVPKWGSDSLAENTPNASKHFSPKCLLKPESFGFLKRSSLWVSVVHALKHDRNKANDTSFLKSTSDKT